jgi:hypothetical protein
LGCASYALARVSGACNKTKIAINDAQRTRLRLGMVAISIAKGGGNRTARA